MCGIAGFWSNAVNTGSAAYLHETIKGMGEALTSRGPDDSGFWASVTPGIALGHRRLAVVDLSAAGHQPMCSLSGRFVIVFNGEIYNHALIRAELDESSNFRPIWRGRSDTETLLAAIECWGIEITLQRCIGMFAFALWNIENQTLTLARDRLGEKPLYYGWLGEGDKGAFVFASELKALRTHPSFNAGVSTVALFQYLRFTYVPAPLSIYEGIFKLEPGCLLIVKDAPPNAAPISPLVIGQRYGNMELRRWWSLKHSVDWGLAKPYSSESAAVDALESTLASAVEVQSQADVPAGAFLSGGVDSSIVAALMQSQSLKRVKTFTIGFDEAGFDESSHALAVASHLGTDHQETRVSSKMVQDLIPSLPCIYDEPFADSSQIPTYLVCKAARQHVTVALSGDGSDELFGGYNRYTWGPRIWSLLDKLPFPLRYAFGKAVGIVSRDAWNSVSRFAGVSGLGDKVTKTALGLSSARTLESFYWHLVSNWDPMKVVKGVAPASPSNWEINDDLPAGLNPVERMMFFDAVTYLPDDILCKVDRAAMACSLETRVPFLDHRVVEFAWQLPLNMKVRGNTGKWALRQVLYKYVPKELIERPKAGFAIPIGQWLRGPLRDWAESLLEESRLRQEGYFHPEPIRRAWAEHLTGRRDHTPKIWAILMFQAWLEDQSRYDAQNVTPH